MNIFDRARLMVAQSPNPTTIQEQLSKLARRRRAVRPKDEKPHPVRRYWWQEE